MQKQLRLYNVLFPLWMLLLFPQMWLIVLPGNFLIDSMVLLAAMFVLRLAGKGKFYKRHILKIYCFGLVSDVIGAGWMLLLAFGLSLGQFGDEWYLTVPALLISAACIYAFNYAATFRQLDKRTRLCLSLIFAVVTAPYTFLVPSSWLYGF